MSYSPTSTPGQGFVPRPPRSERRVLAVRRSRKVNSRLFMPLAHASTLDRCGASAATRHRGGVLEPGARLRWKMRRRKQPSYMQLQLRVPAGEDLSLSGGASMSCSVFFTLGITSLVSSTRLQTTKATLSDRPRFELLCRYTSSGSNPQRGPGCRRTAANRMASAGTTRRSRHRSRPGQAFRGS